MDQVERNNSIRDYLESVNRAYDIFGNIYENTGGILDFANSTFNAIEKGAELFDDEKLEKAYYHIQIVNFLNSRFSKIKKIFYFIWFILVVGAIAGYFLL